MTFANRSDIDFLYKDSYTSINSEINSNRTYHIDPVIDRSVLDTTTSIYSFAKNLNKKNKIKKKRKKMVVFDGDYTIYHDGLGNRTIVKRMESEQYDKEKAVMYAILKSKGIKPKDIANLINNSVDKKINREKRKEKKLQKRKKK